MDSKLDFVYNPDNQSKKELIDNFVVRLDIFQLLLEKLSLIALNNATISNFLIEGKRGMGKTTLLLRMAYEIENNSNLTEHFIPVVFNEEEYGVRRLYKLWERVALLIQDKNPQFEDLFQKMDENFSTEISEEEYETKIFSLLETSVLGTKKKLILFIDNFGDMLVKFNSNELARFEELMMKNSVFNVIGASSVSIENFYDNSKKIFEVFRLSSLNKIETENLLLKLAERFDLSNIEMILKTHPGKVETLRRLTGGVIRTIVLLFEIFIDQKNGKTFADLETLLDRVTPLYKHRMDDLTAQQQEIIEALAFAWDAINVKEISAKTRIVSKSISAQLIQMEKNEMITKKQTNNKNHLYQISERFFNIWYMMRHGRKGDRKKIQWLVRFLEEWCDKKELIERTNQHINLLENGEYDVNGAYYLTEALASTKSLPPKSQDKLIKVAREFLKGKNSKLADDLSESLIELLEKVEQSFKEKEYKTALRYLKRLERRDSFLEGLCHYALEQYTEAEECFVQSANEGNPHAMHQLGIIYSKELDDASKAEKYLLDSIKGGFDRAYVELVRLYEDKIDNKSRAHEYYLKVLELNNASGIAHLGLFFEDSMGNYDKAQKLYSRAIELGDKDALTFLGDLYCNKLKDFNKAEFYYLEAIESGFTDEYLSLALLYSDELKDEEKALRFYRSAIEHGNKKAYFYLAVFYHLDLHDYEMAKVTYKKAIEYGSKESLLNLGILYEDEYGDIDNAMVYYEMGVKINDVRAIVCLARVYDMHKQDYKTAEKYYRQAIKQGSSTAMNNLAYIFYDQKRSPVEALELAEKAYNLENDTASRLTLAKVLIWNNHFQKGKKVANEFMYDPRYFKEYLDYFTDFLCLLMAKGQYSFLKEYFTNPEYGELMLKERLKPVWYALAFYIKEELPNEFLRMGDELKETVSELVEKTEKMREAYKV